MDIPYGIPSVGNLVAIEDAEASAPPAQTELEMNFH